MTKAVTIWQACVLLVGATLSCSANAIIDGSIDANSTTSPWAGVGSLMVNGGTFTATAIGSRFVLTAAHVVSGATANNVQFNLNVGSNLSSVIQASNIHIYPDYQGFVQSPDDGMVHNDLAIVELSSDLPSNVPIYPILNNMPANKMTVTMVGYGQGGNGVDGVTSNSSPTVKRTGSNQLDMLYNNSSGKLDMYMFDFDGPDLSSNVIGGGAIAHEAQLGTGDSGSPAFVRINGNLKIAGINTFVANQQANGDVHKYGALGGGTLTPAYSGWVESVITSPVPEPTPIAMYLSGGLLLLLASQRQNNQQ